MRSGENGGHTTGTSTHGAKRGGKTRPHRAGNVKVREDSPNQKLKSHAANSTKPQPPKDKKDRGKQAGVKIPHSRRKGTLGDQGRP